MKYDADTGTVSLGLRCNERWQSEMTQGECTPDFTPHAFRRTWLTAQLPIAELVSELYRMSVGLPSSFHGRYLDVPEFRRLRAGFVIPSTLALYSAPSVEWRPG